MDRAIIEILNSNALLLISIIAISLMINIYYSSTNSIDNLEIELIYLKIKNLIYEIYMKSNYFDNFNITLILDKQIYLKANSSNTLIIKIGNIEKIISSYLKINGEGYSNSFIFSYSNGLITIKALSPLYIPPLY
jgi:hypothetical protein